jgi:hypothetical protein
MIEAVAEPPHSVRAILKCSVASILPTAEYRAGVRESNSLLEQLIQIKLLLLQIDWWGYVRNAFQNDLKTKGLSRYEVILSLSRLPIFKTCHLLESI